MIKKLKTNKIIPIILQILRKKKCIFSLLKQINKKNLYLLDFLWQHKFIFGYTIAQNMNLITIYLKSYQPNNQSCLSRPKLFCNLENFKQIQKWSKNSFFIIMTTKGLYTIKQSLTCRIGGFLLYKFY